MPQTKFTTSFIPKKPIQTASKGGVIKKRGMGFFSLISFIIFVLAILGFAGVFFYKINLKNQKDSQIANLQKAKEFFDPEFISEANRLNDRLLGVKELLNKHTSPSQIFDLFETYTLGTVRFSNLQLSIGEGGVVTASASGIARGFESIVLQSDEYGKSGFLRDVIFSGLQPNQEGLVSFTFQSTIDADLIYYRNTLGSVPPAKEEEQANEKKDFFDQSDLIENSI